MKQVLSILILFPLLSGCGGVGFFYPSDSAPLEHPTITRNVGVIYPGGLHEKITKCSEVKLAWGDPDQVITNANETSFKYKFDHVWAGVMPMLIIPIPIAIPVARKTTTITCVNDLIVRASGTETGYWSAFCGHSARSLSGVAMLDQIMTLAACRPCC